MNSQNGKEETNNKAGARIRAYRERHDWSVYDLAQKSGVEEKTINAIEKGEVMPALGVLVKIAQALVFALMVVKSHTYTWVKRQVGCDAIGRKFYFAVLYILRVYKTNFSIFDDPGIDKDRTCNKTIKVASSY